MKDVFLFVGLGVAWFYSVPLGIFLIIIGLIYPKKRTYVPNSLEELKKLVENLDINLGDIYTSKITTMSELFYKSKRLDFKGIEKWDVSNVTNMRYMFASSQFNGDISNWDVLNVTNMAFMFASSQFNGDISNWNVSNVTNMDFMFENSQFNGDISNWDLSNIDDYENLNLSEYLAYENY